MKIADATIIRLLREVPTRHVYEGGDARGKPTGRWFVSHGCTLNIELTTEEVLDLQKRRVLELDYPGFYKLHQQYRSA